MIFSNGLISLAAAAASTLVPGTSFWNSWIWWAASAGIGNLLMAPFLLSWASLAKTGGDPWNPKRILEGAALFILLSFLNFFAFRTLATSPLFSLLLPYVTFPFLLWAALRFGTPGVTLALVILAATAISFAAAGPAIDLADTALNHVIDVQLYLAIMAIPSLFLAAVVTERKQTEEALREREARLNKAEEIARVGSWELDLATDRLSWSDETYRIFGLPPQSFVPTYQSFLTPPTPRTAPRLIQRIQSLSGKAGTRMRSNTGSCEERREKSVTSAKNANTSGMPRAGSSARSAWCTTSPDANGRRRDCGKARRGSAPSSKIRPLPSGKKISQRSRPASTSCAGRG